MEPADAPPLPETIEAIAGADLITMGPGSLFTSLITNLLVPGIAEAIATSPARRVYICNLMTQANESLGLTASQHIEKILAHCKPYARGARIFDYALINTGPIHPDDCSSSTPAKASSLSSPTLTASAHSASSPSPATSSTKATCCATATTSSPKPFFTFASEASALICALRVHPLRPCVQLRAAEPLGHFRPLLPVHASATLSSWIHPSSKAPAFVSNRSRSTICRRSRPQPSTPPSGAT